MAKVLSFAELKSASEAALWFAVDDSDRHRAGAAIQVTSDFRLLELWRLRHERLLNPVAAASGRFGQPARLRAAGVMLLERCALIDYLREYGIDKRGRYALMVLLRGDASRRALLEEHRDYVLALSSLICIERLLHQVGDPPGPRLLAHYRCAYLGQFATYCEDVRAAERRLDSAVIELTTEVRSLKRVLTDPQDGLASL